MVFKSQQAHSDALTTESSPSDTLERFRGGLVFKAHIMLYHSTLGSRVIKKTLAWYPNADTVCLARRVLQRGEDRVRCHQTQQLQNTPRDPKAKKCFICSRFYGRACRWAMLGELKPKGRKHTVSFARDFEQKSGLMLVNSMSLYRAICD